MAGFKNLRLTLVSFSLFLSVYLIYFINVSFAQEKMLENGWISGTPMPTPRTEVTSANLDVDVYVIGGFTSDGETPFILNEILSLVSSCVTLS